MLSQLLVQILAQTVRPAGWGSHTREISIAISNTHIITHTAQLLTLGVEGALVQNINLLYQTDLDSVMAGVVCGYLL